MKRIVFTMSAVIAVLVLVASVGTAEGRQGRGGLYLSDGGFSIAFGLPAAFGVSHGGYYPYRGSYDRPGYSRRGYSGTSLFFSFGTGRTYGGDRHYGRRHGYYPRYRYRDYRRGHDYYPDRGIRAWIPGRMHDGRYRFGYWDYRENFRNRDDHRGRGRDRY